ncbi:2-hydroxyacid dehydrogenase [Tatumella citrea]|uniref:Glycerate dehydrogenase n=1 Tax=Tatumella citrea TaxID=53336 RepID=A0A1Y0LB23_TATCI|nr:2-hydroxyacid dehydrogenase [Tatumella citrea]ARU95252.1 glycerate dehydrogenase [Tatumella citrea]ARU99292.1 glycerate dehydrogenase [Tatumella citrea]
MTAASEGRAANKAVFLDYASLDFGDLDPACLYNVLPELELYPHTAPAEIVERLQDAEIAIVSDLLLPAEIFSQLPQLKLVLLSATGTNAVDLQAARQHGVTVCNCQGYGTHSVAQHTLALILSLTNHVARYDALVRQGDWAASDRFCLTNYPLTELNGKLLGIVGQGELGSKVAQLAEAFGMQVRFAQLPGRDSSPDKLPLDELLATADVVALHCPLTPETSGLINSYRLSLMKPSALLINSARGALIDEQALAEALRRGEIGGAAVDVLSQEPPSPDNPLLAGGIPNLLITPHIAWGSTEARQGALFQLAENVSAWQSGAALRVVS